MTTFRGVKLIRRPQGLPTADDFEFVEEELPALGENEVEVQNSSFSVDPYMRRRMNPAGSKLGAFTLNEIMTGRTAGRVTRSTSVDFAVGDLVVHDYGWRTSAVVPSAECEKKVPVEGQSDSVYLGILGWPGWTAWVGLHEAAGLKQGDRMFISAASGSVGTSAAQFAKQLGVGSIVGSTGSSAKALQLVETLPFDHAFSYRDRPVAESLAEVAPEGIDLYYDNVGGAHLQAAWDAMRIDGRIVICGQIGDYNGEDTAGLKNLHYAIQRELTMRGFAVVDFPATQPVFEEKVGEWLRAGVVHNVETVFDGIDSSLEAFHSLFSGEKVGKVVVSAT